MKKTLYDIKNEILFHAKNKNRLVFVSGKFNVIHPGYVRFLNFAATVGDFLIVCLVGDDNPGIFINQHLRLEALKNVSVVDYAFILPGELEECLDLIRPEVVVKGKEYEDMFNREAAIVKDYGGELLFSSGEVRFSSLELLHNELVDLNLATITKPKIYLDRHSIKINKLINIVRSFGEIKVVVVGDVIIDEYISCDALGMSQEDPTLVVSPIKKDIFLGGAGIVSAHARAMGADVLFVSIVGSDATASIVNEKLRDHGVEAKLFVDQTRKTTLKQRFRAQGKTLLRVSHLDQHEISHDLAGEFLVYLEKAIKGADLLVFSDFNYGCLPQWLVNNIIDLCKKLEIPMAADSQSSSQTGNIARFSDMILITPTEYEARLAIRNPDLGLAALAQSLYDKNVAKTIIITLGSEGLIIHSEAHGVGLITEKLPALNSAPKDVAGAGDSLLITTAMALVCGATSWEASYLGAIAAACQVGRVGNLPLSCSDLIKELNY